MNDKEKLEKIIECKVNEVLLINDVADNNSLVSVCADDGGNCIHVTVVECVPLSVVVQIAAIFGDDDPLISAEKPGEVGIVCQNEKAFF